MISSRTRCPGIPGSLPSSQRLGRDFAENLRLLEDLGWTETTDRETVALNLPSGELTDRTLARLHRPPRGRSATTPRGKDDEGLAQRDLAAS